MTTRVERHSDSADSTQSLGRRLGARLRAGDLLVLDGDLGAGKTCFVKGLAAGLGFDPMNVRSPTFVFHHVYRAPLLTLHHIDCYRLGPGADLAFLDLDDLLMADVGVIEWGMYADLSPWQPSHISIDINAGDERSFRLVTAAAHLAGAWDGTP